MNVAARHGASPLWAGFDGRILVVPFVDFVASRPPTAARRPPRFGGGQGAAEDGQRVQQLQR